MEATDKKQPAASKLDEFYQHKTITITGVTGFIGKVLLLKLLTCLSGFTKVYLLMRAKKGKCAEERFRMMIKKEPFVSPPNDNNPNGHPTWSRPKEGVIRGISSKQISLIDWSKVVPVEVDMSKANLGLSEVVKEELCSSVQIVFHIAASVSFSASLKQHLEDNYLSSRNMLELAKNFDKLVSYVHVSSFYANSHLSHVEEKILPLELGCEESAELIQNLPKHVVDKITADIIECRANTYVYSKAMVENLLLKYEQRLPIAIVRPSVVLPAVNEPYPAWTDNSKGFVGLGALGYLGILRNIDWNYDGVFDIIPVDYVVNSMFAVAERTARLSPNDIKVYNCSSSSLNPITFGKIFDTLSETNMKAPPYKMLRMPIEAPKHNRSSRFNLLIGRISEWTFAYFIDSLLFILGQKPLVCKLTSKLHKGYDVLRYFTTHHFTCSNENLVNAFNELHPMDKVQFSFQPQNINWHEYLEHYVYGTRRLIFKENPDDIPAAKRKMKVHMVVEFFLRMFFNLLVAVMLLKIYCLYFKTSLPKFIPLISHMTDSLIICNESQSIIPNVLH